METFAGKVAIVTGAASGIGRAVAEGLAVRGARVTLADIDDRLLEEAARSIAGPGGKAKAVRVDVTDGQAVNRLVGETVEEEGRLDYMFNNAGVAVIGHAEDHNPDDWRFVLNVNLFGVINGVSACYPVMTRQRSGHIVNTASLAGLLPAPAEIAYTTSKYGVVGLSNALRIEAAVHGVKVSVVCPGFIRTPIYQSSRMLGYDRERLLKLAPGSWTPSRAAAVILRGVERNRATIPVTPHAHFLWRVYRLSPALFEFGAKFYLKGVDRARVLGSNHFCCAPDHDEGRGT